MPQNENRGIPMPSWLQQQLDQEQKVSAGLGDPSRRTVWTKEQLLEEIPRLTWAADSCKGSSAYIPEYKLREWAQMLQQCLEALPKDFNWEEYP